jgi:DNA repair exonuclease SbcCD nuclease subunit
MADCFIHASDLHLDQQIAGIGRLVEYEDDIARDLARAARGALESLVDLAIDRSASFVVLAGDIFDDGSAFPAVQLHFHDQLRRLDDEGIPVFICHGNHDPLDKDFTRTGRLPDNVKVFGTENPETFYVPLRNGPGSAAVSGLSFPERHVEENLALRFHDLEPVDVPHVAVLHADLGGSKDHLPYAPCNMSDLADAPVDYWALGHIHLRAVEDLGPGRYAAYCGNLQGRKFKASECHPKGALVVPIGEHGIGEPEFVACDRVRFVMSVVTVDADQEIEDVIRAARDAAKQAGNAAGDRPVVWSLRLEGWHSDLSELRKVFDYDKSDPLEIRDLLNDGGLAEFDDKDVKNPLLIDELVAAGGFPAELVGATKEENEVGTKIDELVADLLPTVKEQFDYDKAARTEIARLTFENLRLFLAGNDG